MGCQSSRPINAFGGGWVHARFQKPRFDEHLFGDSIQALDYLFYGCHFLLGRHHDNLAAPRIGHGFAAFGIDESVGDGGNDIGGGGVLKLDDFGDERRWRGRVPLGDAGDFALGIFNDLKIVIVEQSAERLLGGDVFPTDGDCRLGRQLLCRGINLAETDLGVEHVIQTGHARQVPDRVGELGIIHNNDWNDGSRLGGAARCEYHRRVGVGWRLGRYHRGSPRRGFFGARTVLR